MYKLCIELWVYNILLLLLLLIVVVIIIMIVIIVDVFILLVGVSINSVRAICFLVQAYFYLYLNDL